MKGDVNSMVFHTSTVNCSKAAPKSERELSQLTTSFIQTLVLVMDGVNDKFGLDFSGDLHLSLCLQSKYQKPLNIIPKSNV